MASPYAPNRILAPRAVLLGTGNPNSLQNVIPDTLADRVLCFVRDQNSLYYLDKSSTAAVSVPTVVATMRGAGVPGRWIQYGSGAADDIFVDHVLFVDQVNYGFPVSNGSLSKPFETIQEAIDQAVTNGWVTVAIRVAPGTYTDDVTIPIVLQSTSIEGWTDGTFIMTAIVNIDADVSLTSGVSEYNYLQFVDCQIGPYTIAADNPATHDMNVSFVRCAIGASIEAFNMVVNLSKSTLLSSVTAHGGLTVNFDGESWYNYLKNSPIINPADYTRTFSDTGANTYATVLNVVDLAVGDSTYIDLAVPEVRAGDYAIIQCINPSTRDFTCYFHASSAGNIVAHLTNVGRDSTNFNDAIEILVFHATMAYILPT